MPIKRNLQRASQSRVFTLEGGAQPGVSPVYQGLARAQAVTWNQGTITVSRVPSDRKYSSFIAVDRYRGQKGLPTLPIEFRMTRDASDVLRLTRKDCELDIQVHVGSCTDPTDFLAFEKIMVLEGALANNYQTTELGAFDGNQENNVGETVPFEGLDYYEIVPILPGEIASSEILQECVAVCICDEVTCAECGLPSDGCQTMFIVQKAHGGSPGLPAELLYSTDGGASFGATHVSTLAANKNPSGMACVGTNLVVISNEDNSIHYAPIADILAGTETWTKVVTGLVSNKAPNAIFSLGRSFTWLVGDGGYIYFSSDITAGVDVQASGGQTVQNLLGIHGTDELHLVAVGASNAVLVTNDGGAAWAAVTGPNVAVQLNTVAMKSSQVWLIGADDGTLWYTRDAGANFAARSFPGSGAGKVKDVQFASPTVGYMAHITATPVGYILRSIDGGQTWYRLPEAAGLSIPDNDGINALAACRDNVNVCFGAGLGANATDGFAVKAA